MLIRNVAVSCIVVAMAGVAALFLGEARGAGIRWLRPQLRNVSIDGTIEKVASGAIYAVNDKDQQQWAIETGLDTKILVTGTALPDFLKKGLLVQIDAQPDEKGIIKDKLSKLTIVTPATEGQAMLPDIGGKPKGKPGKPAPFAASGDFKGTVAMIVGIHAQKLSLKIDKKLSEVELADDATINVSVDILTWAAKGDKIQVTGLSNPKNPGFCLAKDVSITLAQPLTRGKKKVAAAKSEATSTDKAAATDKSAASGDDATPQKKKGSNGSK